MENKRRTEFFVREITRIRETIERKHHQKINVLESLDTLTHDIMYLEECIEALNIQLGED